MKEDWLMPGAIVPVNMETTVALVAEIKRLRAVDRERQPLTDDEIWRFWWARPEVPDGEDDSMEAEFVAAVRRVLAAHGKGEA